MANTIGERIKSFRSQTGMNQKEFAEACSKIDNRERSKWGQSRIANYETNARKPDFDDIKIIAQILNIEPAELAFGDNTEVELTGRPKEGALKVVGEAIMGVDGEFEMTEKLLGFIKIYSSDPEAYCLKVKGTSMEPRIFSGEFVVIEPSTSVYPGDEVFIRTNDGRNMIKIFDYLRDGEYRFSSVNKEHEDFTMDIDDVEVMSAVSAIIKRSRFISLDDMEGIEF